MPRSQTPRETGIHGSLAQDLLFASDLQSFTKILFFAFRNGIVTTKEWKNKTIQLPEFGISRSANMSASHFNGVFFSKGERKVPRLVCKFSVSFIFKASSDS